MAVYDRRWRRYQGHLSSLRWRWLVITRYGLREVFGSRLFLVFYLLCTLPSLLTLVIVYGANNVGILEKIGATPQAIEPFITAWLRGVFPFQTMLGFLLTVIIAPNLVAPDLSDGAMPLLLSRPISRTGYVVGKLAILGLLLSPVTWIGSALFVGLHGLLRGPAWWQEHFRILLGHLLGHGVWIVVICLLSVAISVWVRYRWFARALLLGQLFVLAAFAHLFNALLRTRLGTVLDLGELLTIVVTNLFGLQMPSGTLPVWAAWLVLMLVCVVSVVVLARKVRAHEVIS